MKKLTWSQLLPAGAIAAAAVVFLLTGFGPSGNVAVHSGAEVSPSPSLEFDPRVLLREFQSAQQAQMKALLDETQSSAKTLKSSQTAKQKEFDQREKAARRKYFADPHPGPEKRAYMHDLLARRDTFRKALANERTQDKQDSDDRVQALKARQEENLQRFRDALGRGERPADALWPQPGS